MTFRLAESGWMVGAACALVLTGAGTAVATGASGAGGGGIPPMLSFATSVTYAAGENPSSVTAGDWNGDKKADLAVANYDSNDVSILLNTSQ